MQQVALNDLLETAVAAAKAAGLHALNNKDRRFERNSETAHDVKLVLDVESQVAAEQVITERFSEHAILGEESVEQVDVDGYQWIIDPIDGTVNFSHGFPYWCSSVAVRFNGKVLAGCVFAPELKNCYTAHIEAPALKNGDPISVSDTNEMSDALVLSGLSKQMQTPGHDHFEMFKQLVHNTRKVRISGAAALDLCQLAEGNCDGFFEEGIKLWDFAAGQLIAERAGADFFVIPMSEPYSARIGGSNGRLLDHIRAIYDGCFV